MKKRILVIEDEKKIADVIQSYLLHEGYEADIAYSGEEGIRLHKEKPYDLILLDLMLPGLSGEETCKRLRSFSRVSIIMLTAKTEEQDKLDGFRYGADDYMTKPFAPKELIARVGAVLRRASSEDLLADKLFIRKDLVIDDRAKAVWRNDEKLGLTPTEYKILHVLAQHPQRTFSREELVEKVMGFDFEGDARVIDTHIKNLRRKIEIDPKNPQIVVAVYGTGYRLGDS